MPLALMLDAFDGPRSLAVREIVRRPLGAREVRIDARAAGLNFHDLLIARGQYQAKPALPHCPGSECAGTVIETGSQVRCVHVGDRVVAMTAERGGCLATEVVTSEDDVFAAPPSLDWAHASAFAVSYGTALYALTLRGALQPGETLLVHGSAGGVGYAGVQIGRAMGARVVACVDTPRKAALVRGAGADHVLQAAPGRLKDDLQALTAGRGVDVVLDTLGGDHFDAALRAIAWNGRILVVGFASGRIPSIEANRLLLKGCAATGVFFGRFARQEPDRVRELFGQLATMAPEHRLTPHVREQVALADAPAALARLDDPQALGKVVVDLHA